ncbi:MAG: hypothetical protein QM657_07195 [Lacrimispora sp.]|uniref:hypothetical protein n=1 Tax=Lacrimispora sp. TaxID=2719234 RepID=UPI0039E4DCFE
MAIPIIAGAIALGSAAIGGTKLVKGAIDTNSANRVQNDAKEILSSAQSSMEKSKSLCRESIEELGKSKLNLASGPMNDFVTFFSLVKNVQIEDSAGLDELSKIKADKISFSEMQKTVLAATDILGSGIAGVGAGALLSWGTYGGVMALGTASTGTAIGTLSGVAATNATLAWLGGGAIAAGGGGMALGTLVLGGLLAGPALLIAGGLFGAKASTNLNNAYSNLAEAKRLAEELKLAKIQVDGISTHANILKDIIEKMYGMVKLGNIDLKYVIKEGGTDWNQYTESQKKQVAIAMKIAQLSKAIIDTPMLSEDGKLTDDIRKIADKKSFYLDLVMNDFI